MHAYMPWGQNMKNLLRAALVLGSLPPASGCFSVHGDTNSGRFALTWTVSTEAGQEIDCAVADADTVVVTTIRVGGGSMELFACDDMGGVTDQLTLGRYRVEAWLGKTNGTSIDPRSTEIVSLSNQNLYESGVDVPVDPIAFIVATSNGVSSSVEPR
jgi:hypothetical protein